MYNNINWIKTYQLYNINENSKHISNKKVIYECPKCKNESHILYKAIKKRIYAECLKCIAKNNEYKLKISVSTFKSLNENPDIKKKLSISSKKNWDSKKLKMLEGLHKKWQDKDFLEKKRVECILRNKSIWLDSNRDEHIKKIKGAFTNNRLQKMSLISKSLWQNVNYKEKTINAINEPSNLKLISEISKEKWLNKDYKEKMAGVRVNQPRTSFQQKILYSILDDLNIKYSNDTDEKSKVGYYCFDCRIDPQESINITKPLLIEVQGDYWHELPKNKIKDVQKSTYVQRYFDFDIKYLWEHEFNNKDRIISLIKYWLGMNKAEIVDFDFKCVEQKVIDNKTAELFISKYHYASRIWKNGINLGYYVNSELAAVIIYNNPIRQETATKQGYKYKEVLELSRLAINPKYQIKNLASNIISKSIKFIVNNYKHIKCLVSFTDTTFNHTGIVYKASNWKLDGELAPDYWYVDKDGYVCHKKTLWDKSKKMGMSESEYQVKYGYNKIYGKKKFRFVYNI